MAANNEKKIAEGKEFLREAEKCMKTGLLKWKPDLEGASIEYGKAGADLLAPVKTATNLPTSKDFKLAVAFKNAKAYDLAIDSYMKQADVQKQSGSLFHAAKASCNVYKCLRGASQRFLEFHKFIIEDSSSWCGRTRSIEAAAMMYKESGNLSKAADLIEQASTMYLEHGTQDTAALVLDRAAKMIEQNLPDRAIKLFMKACDVAEAEDRPHQCAEYIGKAARVLIRTKKFDEAAVALKRELDYYSRVENQGLLNKLVMGLVLVHLHRGDYVAADQAFQGTLHYPGFAESEEAGPIQRMLEAYYECDKETVEQIVKSPLFRYMENDFTKLARDLKVPGGGSSKKTASGDHSDVDAVGGDVEKLDLC